jgi:hypothetical protein
LGDNLR